jgi:hypothetical protein
LIASVSETNVADYDVDGVVCLRGQFDAPWIERMRAAIERDLASPGPSATNFAEGSSAGKFFGDMFMWKSDPDFRAAALDSPAAGIAAALMGSANADFFYDQLFVKEPGTAHPTPWHQDQPYWPVKGWQIASVWDRARSGSTQQRRGRIHRRLAPLGRELSPTPFRKGHEIKFTSSDLQQIPDIDADRRKYDIRWWEMEPGDCLVFHAMIVHGAPGQRHAGRAPPRPVAALYRRRCALRSAPGHLPVPAQAGPRRRRADDLRPLPEGLAAAAIGPCRWHAPCFPPPVEPDSRHHRDILAG